MWRPSTEEECWAPCLARRDPPCQRQVVRPALETAGVWPLDPSTPAGWAVSRTVVSQVLAGTRGGCTWVCCCEGSLRGPHPSPNGQGVGGTSHLPHGTEPATPLDQGIWALEIPQLPSWPPWKLIRPRIQESFRVVLSNT